MLRKLFDFFSSHSKQKKDENEVVIPDEVIEALTGKGDILRYPPAERGFPALVPGKALLGLQKEILSDIKRELMIRDSEFEAFIYPMLVNFADFVHLLPASEYHHHRAQGGLLRHTLEVVLYSIKIAKSFEFDANETPVIKSDRALAWRIAVVVGAVMHDIGKPISDVEVWDASGEKHWMPSVNSLPQWAKENQIERYFLFWRPDRHERHHNTSLTKMSDIVPKGLLIFLTEEGNDIYNELTEALAGSNSYRAQSSRTETGTAYKNKIHRIVSTADSRSVKQDLRRYSGDAVRSAQTGVSVVARMMDAMRLLIKRGDWQVNKPGSPIWYTTEGLFIVWGTAVDPITKIVKDSGIAVPHSADSLADLMLSYGLIILNEDGAHYWRMAPHVLNDKAHRESKEPKNSLSCIKIIDAILLFADDVVPNPASCRIKLADGWKEFLASGQKGKFSVSQPYVGERPTGNPLLANVDPEILKGGTLPPTDDKPTDGTGIKRGSKPKDIVDHMMRINLISPEIEQAIRKRDEKERIEREAAERYGTGDVQLPEQNSLNNNPPATKSLNISLDSSSESKKEEQTARDSASDLNYPLPYLDQSMGDEIPDEQIGYDEMYGVYSDMHSLDEQVPSISPTTMSLRERLERAAIEQGYQDDEKNIRTNDANAENNLWEQARKRIQTYSFDEESNLTGSSQGNVEHHIEGVVEGNHLYSSLFRDAPQDTQQMLRKLVKERAKELNADSYHLFIHNREPEDEARYDSMLAAGWVWKPFLEPCERFQMFKSKPGFFLKRGLNEDINYLSGGQYFKNIMPINPDEVYFNEDDVARSIATYGIAKKTYDQKDVITLSGSAMRSMAKSTEIDITTLKFIICFNYDVVHKRGVDHVLVDDRINSFMVASDE
ncbi:MobH family relaxase [Cronobacter turicensis]